MLPTHDLFFDQKCSFDEIEIKDPYLYLHHWVNGGKAAIDEMNDVIMMKNLIGELASIMSFSLADQLDCGELQRVRIQEIYDIRACAIGMIAAKTNLIILLSYEVFEIRC